MILVAYQRTMAGAKPKLQQPPVEEVRFTVEDRRREAREASLKHARKQALALLQERERVTRAIACAASENSRRFRESMGHPSAADIISMVAAWHEVPLEMLLSPTRSLPVCIARIDAMVAVYVNCRIAGRRLKLTDMGRIFKRDHSTVLWTLKKAGLRV